MPPFGLKNEKIEHVKQIILSKGFEIEENGDIENAGWVVGIENEVSIPES